MLQNHSHKKYLCLKAKKSIVSSLLCFIELYNQDLKITKKKTTKKRLHYNVAAYQDTINADLLLIRDDDCRTSFVHTASLEKSTRRSTVDISSVMNSNPRYGAN